MNNELALVACLLKDPKRLTEYEINSTWFANEYCQQVLKALNNLKGTSYQLKDVYREMQAINLLNSGTLEDLDTLVGNAPEDDITAHLVYFVKKDYIERELTYTAKEFALNGTEDLAEKLQNLLAEKNALKQNKPNGRLDNVYQEFLGLIDTEKPLLQTFDKLDNYLGGGLSGGQLVVIGARPAVGKTALGTSMAMEILQKNEGTTIDFFALEMTAWQLTARFVSRKAKINSILFRNPHNLSEKNQQMSKQAFQEIMKHDLRVYGAEYEQLNDIKQVIRKRAKDKAGRYVAFIDYAGLVGVTDSRKTERQVMNEVTRTLKLLTNELDITIILFAQLKRGMEQRAEKKPTLADLKESGSLEQDAHVVLLLSRNEQNEKIIDCQIAKNREGMTGCIPFKFIPQFMDFSIDYDFRYD